MNRLTKSNKSAKTMADDSCSPGVDFNSALELDEKEMIQNTLYYLLVLQGKMHVIRKSDILKTAMNKQSRDFLDVIIRVEKILRRTFGMKLVGMKSGDEELFVECDVTEASSFIMVSRFRQSAVATLKIEKTMSADSVKAALLLILSCIYMMDKAVEEGVIWEILEKVELANLLCKRREDLKRFLKNHYVDSLYLSKLETKDSDQTVVRYEWGFRANQEFSKYAILKFVTQQVLGKRPEQFGKQFSTLTPAEIEEIDAEDERLSNAAGTSMMSEECSSENHRPRQSRKRALTSSDSETDEGETSSRRSQSSKTNNATADEHLDYESSDSETDLELDETNLRRHQSQSKQKSQTNHATSDEHLDYESSDSETDIELDETNFRRLQSQSSQKSQTNNATSDEHLEYESSDSD